MPSTPNNYGAPNRTGSINKSLLTPCRRVGLSRIRKTPNSLIKINLSETSTPPHDSIENSLLFRCTETNQTPIHTLENSLEVLPRKQNEMQNEKDHIVISEKRTKTRSKPGRKSLFKDQKDIIEESAKNTEPDSELVSSLVPSDELPNIMGGNVATKKVNIENSMSSKKQKSDINNVDLELDIGLQGKIDGHSICTKKSNVSSAEVSEICIENIESPDEKVDFAVRKSKKRNIFNELCLDDDDDLDSKKDTRAKKGKKDSKNPSKTAKTIRNTKSDYPIDYCTEKKTESPDSEDDFIPNGKKAKLQKTKSLPEKSSVIHISYSSTKPKNKKSKKISRTLSTKKTSNDTMETDDEFESFQSTPPLPPMVKSVKVKLRNLSEFEIDELSNVTKDDKQSKHTEHVSDDELTCSPTVKNSLVQQIESLEATIRNKTKKLEDLKQASVYKNMHNIEELAKLTETWKNGCKAALSDLLKQLQMHNPIDMRTLVKNLKIPSDIVAKLKLFDSDSQDSV